MELGTLPSFPSRHDGNGFFPSLAQGTGHCWQRGWSSHRPAGDATSLKFEVFPLFLQRDWVFEPNRSSLVQDRSIHTFRRWGMTELPPPTLSCCSFFTNSTNSPLWYLQVLTEMSINTECFSGTPSLCDPLLCFLHLFYINHLKIPVDDTAGQQRKYSYNLPWSSVQPLRQTTCSARDHPTPVQVYTFLAKIPWESGKAADDGWIHLCATTFPAAKDHVRNNLRGEQSMSLGKVEDMEINQGKITALQNSLHYAAMER